ncbi:hypothetical protein, variant [Aphanomyces invadans]|uniref:Uncharacterized protein n=1 Tax=Aphanomyces invadans TaxID=157072 RepID=A0A024UFZ1_9STRA|nr:hypothetical protein, variant [Aphanomyces invadans]ETW04543.1 hypothetical protein, variant [Aphanomyces invadans]|eukprot:XP_008865980.1 hypothetical protein, variant [Aphanomyces invadans]
MASSVVLRIKRKRNDEPIEQLAVHGQQDLQKKIRLEDALNSLSLAQGGDKTSSTTTDTSPGTSIFVFSRIDTVSSASNDKQLQRRLEKSIQRYHSEMLKRDRVLKTKVNSKDVHQAQRQQKRIQRIYQGRGLNVVDVDVPRNEDNCDLLVNNTAMRTKSANRVLNPMERNIDEAIWIAFQRNDFSVFFQVKHQISNAYEFQRPADGGTILMAAAMHNRVDVIELLLAHSSASILLRDGHGKTAADIASDQGHAMAAAALRACESVEAEKDYVYDVYSIDITATQDITPSNSKKDLPVVSVSSSVERWLAHEAFGDLDSADRDLVYDVDGNDSDNEMLEYDTSHTLLFWHAQVVPGMTKTLTMKTTLRTITLTKRNPPLIRTTPGIMT